MSNQPVGELHPYGLPMGTVRGFMSLLICSFFWLVLLIPNAQPAPLGHFFLLTLVFLAFASHPLPEGITSAFLPWLMRLLFVGGSAAVVIYMMVKHPDILKTRMTPDAGEVSQWPVLLSTLAGGFGAGLAMRFFMGRSTPMFQTMRAWIGILSIILLLAETIFQFLIKPNMSEVPGPDTMKVWEGIVIAFVACYFGTRA
jgi:hypothetical protein